MYTTLSVLNVRINYHKTFRNIFFFSYFTGETDMGGPRRPIAVRRIDTYRQPSKRSSTRREGLGSSPGYFEFMTDIRSCRQCHMYMSAMTYGSGDSRAGNAPFWVFGGPPVVLCHRIKSVNTVHTRSYKIKTDKRIPPGR